MCMSIINGRLYFNFQIKLNPSNCIIHVPGTMFSVEVEQVQPRNGGLNYILCRPMVVVMAPQD